MAKQRMTSNQIAGLFVKQVVESVKRGDSLRITNYNERGWASTLLSERQANWLIDTYEREERRGRASRDIVDDAGRVIGFYSLSELSNGSIKFLGEIKEAYREDIPQWQK